jgi:hypothetical protein
MLSSFGTYYEPGDVMKCANIVIYKINNNDCQKEIDDNCVSLERKYVGKGRRVHVVPDGQTAPESFGDGEVGVYVLGHRSAITANVGTILFDQLFKRGAKVSKINVACCGSKKLDQVDYVSNELKRLNKLNEHLPDGLMVCGYTVNLSTFDCQSEWWKTSEKVKYDNFDSIKTAADNVSKEVRTVVTDHDKRKLAFTHEVVSDGVKYEKDVKELFNTTLKEYWKLSGGNFRGNLNTKPEFKNKPLTADTEWQEFEKEFPIRAKEFIVKNFWGQFTTVMKEQGSATATIWTSLQSYVALKKVRKWVKEKDNFVAVSLHEYCGNEGIKKALSIQESAYSTKGICFAFSPVV